ncbi:MAG TPA: hypothetical protein VGH38_27605, partial [Bryobacteraceae bacterium]
LLLSALVVGEILAADPEAAIRRTFIQPWVQAIATGQTTGLKKLLHPKVQACMNDRTREYFDYLAAKQSSARGNYRITKLEPFKGAAPLFMLPADGFSYPVQPTYEVNIDFEQANTTMVRYLAEANGSWYEVQPCPNEKGIAFMHEAIAKRDEQRKRVAQLAAELKEPLRGELIAMLKQHRLRDAAKRYQEATGLDDLTIAVMVVNTLDPEHSMGKR